MKASLSFPKPVEKVLMRRGGNKQPFQDERVVLVFREPSPTAIVWAHAARVLARTHRLTLAERELCARRALHAVHSEEREIRVAVSDVTAVVAVRTLAGGAK